MNQYSDPRYTRSIHGPSRSDLSVPDEWQSKFPRGTRRTHRVDKRSARWRGAPRVSVPKEIGLGSRKLGRAGDGETLLVLFP